MTDLVVGLQRLVCDDKDNATHCCKLFDEFLPAQGVSLHLQSTSNQINPLDHQFDDPDLLGRVQMSPSHTEPVKSHHDLVFVNLDTLQLK